VAAYDVAPEGIGATGTARRRKRGLGQVLSKKPYESSKRKRSKTMKGNGVVLTRGDRYVQQGEKVFDL